MNVTAMNRLKTISAILAGVTLTAILSLSVNDSACVAADDLATEIQADPPNRWMLVCCGLPGDDEHRVRLTEACQRLIDSSEPVLGVAPERLRVLVGDDEMAGELQSDGPEIEVCERESIESAMTTMAQSVSANDGLWIVLLGHAHLYGGGCQFNIQGPDIDQTDFASWASAISCREQVIWNTLPVSGFWTKPLSKEGRIVLSATEADLEFTGTEMPYALSSVLSGDQEHQALEDIDGDEKLSLLDLYLATNIEITMRFRSMDRLQTEHAQLDDNGDGRGSELQIKYLPPEPVDEEEETDEEDEDEDEDEKDDSSEESIVTLPKPPIIQRENMDGYRSRFVLLLKSPATE